MEEDTYKVTATETTTKRSRPTRNHNLKTYTRSGGNITAKMD